MQLPPAPPTLPLPHSGHGVGGRGGLHLDSFPMAASPHRSSKKPSWALNLSCPLKGTLNQAHPDTHEIPERNSRMGTPSSLWWLSRLPPTCLAVWGSSSEGQLVPEPGSRSILPASPPGTTCSYRPHRRHPHPRNSEGPPGAGATRVQPAPACGLRTPPPLLASHPPVAPAVYPPHVTKRTGGRHLHTRDSDQLLQTGSGTWLHGTAWVETGRNTGLARGQLGVTIQHGGEANSALFAMAGQQVTRGLPMPSPIPDHRNAARRCLLRDRRPPSRGLTAGCSSNA